MALQELKKGIYSVGAKDWDRRIFDELIPLPDGTSYNSYLIKGEKKTALIDSVDPEKKDELFTNLQKLNVGKIDYIIANHAEQDHSGSIPHLLAKYPDVMVVTNQKCKLFLQDLLHIQENKFLVIKDGETISLGDKTLEFIFCPWVHWPETMATYLKEDKILFSCDFFGSHLATSNLFVKNIPKVIEDAKRYYAEIMMPFRIPVRKNIEKIETLDFEIIAPSHGPVYDKPEIIINAYKDWISDRVENEVVLPYVSMHGSTERMVSFFIDSLIEKGIKVRPFNLIKTDLGQLATALVDAATVVIATPTVLAGPHPAAVYAVSILNALKPKTKFASVIGSYGWGGRTVEIIKANLINLKLEFLTPVLIKGFPKEDNFLSLEKLAEEIYLKHNEIIN
jgi:flavorubredoxin